VASLERDRLVAQSGIKAGVRKSHITYALGADAENLFPKAYGRLVSLPQLRVVCQKSPEINSQIIC
jgi:hypothetical protein